MNILSVEPTPSPNVMKLNVDEQLPEGVSRNFTTEKKENAPEAIQKLLQIKGVQGVFQVLDFISIERHPRADWRDILAEVGAIFGSSLTTADPTQSAADTFGEIQVSIQMFKGIPSQVKLVSGAEETRFGLAERFSKAVMKLRSTGENYILERTWEEQGPRYGTFKEIGEEVVQELEAAYDDERIKSLLAQALGEKPETPAETLSPSEMESLLQHPDWEKRFAALEKIDPTVEDIPLLADALNDSKTSIRRLATVYLGMIEKPEALPHLYKALRDSSAAVRRTAGDALSDIGDPAAIPAMIESLSDSNKLVRWRAARFLFEVGDESALEDLKAAQHDPEFEVSLQARLAMERIERGEAASGTIWQQMSRKMQEDQNDSDDRP
ncbi:virulence factor [Ammoniphilus oxalaticus]|uniref:Virulence factor n=1 Tax=Ammoniphilus oxalaticus TaxID=66863 RepID=A0A419SK64_9BACL|nr:conserved virulence factor C family protein [Ammoniphilus oxalaticus]RKD24340.1 virulence factor [Ammoniphilus oxalaticus]